MIDSQCEIEGEHRLALAQLNMYYFPSLSFKFELPNSQ